MKRVRETDDDDDAEAGAEAEAAPDAGAESIEDALIEDMFRLVIEKARPMLTLEQTLNTRLTFETLSKHRERSNALTDVVLWRSAPLTSRLMARIVGENAQRAQLTDDLDTDEGVYFKPLLGDVIEVFILKGLEASLTRLFSLAAEVAAPANAATQSGWPGVSPRLVWQTLRTNADRFGYAAGLTASSSNFFGLFVNAVTAFSEQEKQRFHNNNTSVNYTTDQQVNLFKGTFSSYYLLGVYDGYRERESESDIRVKLSRVPNYDTPILLLRRLFERDDVAFYLDYVKIHLPLATVHGLLEVWAQIRPGDRVVVDMGPLCLGQLWTSHLSTIVPKGALSYMARVGPFHLDMRLINERNITLYAPYFRISGGHLTHFLNPDKWRKVALTPKLKKLFCAWVKEQYVDHSLTPLPRLMAAWAVESMRADLFDEIVHEFGAAATAYAPHNSNSLMFTRDNWVDYKSLRLRLDHDDMTLYGGNAVWLGHDFAPTLIVEAHEWATYVALPRIAAEWRPLTPLMAAYQVHPSPAYDTAFTFLVDKHRSMMEKENKVINHALFASVLIRRGPRFFYDYYYDALFAGYYEQLAPLTGGRTGLVDSARIASYKALVAAYDPVALLTPLCSAISRHTEHMKSAIAARCLAIYFRFAATAYVRRQWQAVPVHPSAYTRLSLMTSVVMGLSFDEPSHLLQRAVRILSAHLEEARKIHQEDPYDVADNAEDADILRFLQTPLRPFSYR